MIFHNLKYLHLSLQSQVEGHEYLPFLYRPLDLHSHFEITGSLELKRDLHTSSEYTAAQYSWPFDLNVMPMVPTACMCACRLRASIQAIELFRNVYRKTANNK